jgi:hypothetical protein
MEEKFIFLDFGTSETLTYDATNTGSNDGSKWRIYITNLTFGAFDDTDYTSQTYSLVSDLGNRQGFYSSSSERTNILNFSCDTVYTTTTGTVDGAYYTFNLPHEICLGSFTEIFKRWTFTLSQLINDMPTIAQFTMNLRLVKEN